jgi:hypothetical protein
VLSAAIRNLTEELVRKTSKKSNNKGKTNGCAGAEYRRLEPINLEISENSRPATAGREKISSRREGSRTAQSRTTVSSNWENTKHPSSPPNSGGPLKFNMKGGYFEYSPSWAAVEKTFGTSDGHLAAELLLQVTRALPTKEICDPDGNHALAALHGIRPRDTLEGMLATQMVAGHNMAMDLLRRAALPLQPPEAMELYLNSATKLQRTFVAQIEVLDRHRGKGEQTMTVEQVHIHDGAQGIVGPFSHQGSMHASADDHGKSN